MWLLLLTDSNPSSCIRCKTKVSQGHSYCNQCAYKSDGESFFHR